MILSDDVLFPNNICELIKLRIDGLDTSEPVDKRFVCLRRPLNPEDGAGQLAGVFPLQWLPEESSHEMKVLGSGRQSSEPSTGQYWINVQVMVQHTDQVQGVSQHAMLSNLVRRVLQRDPVLGVGFAQLSVEFSDGATERFTRRGIRTQRFLNNEIGGAFIYLSTIEMWVETYTS